MRRGFLACATLAACRVAAYPLPTRPPAAPLHAPPAARAETAPSMAALAVMETACRQGLRAETVRASLATMDRVRLALGSVCGLAYVGADPLHWRLHCGTDDFFGVGQYALTAAPDRNGVPTTAPCAALGRRVPALQGVPVHRWVCAGAVLAELTAARPPESATPGGRVELATLGHADGVPFRAEGVWDACPALRSALGFTPAEAWAPLAEGAPPEARVRANEQLSWCRAAQVARALRCGMALVAQGGRRVEGDPCAGLRPEDLGGVGGAGLTSVVGAGTSWYRAQSPGTCSAEPNGLPASCPEARRVDVFVRFVPAAEPVDAPCPRAHDDPAGALYCLQECLERAAAPARDATPRLAGTELHRACGGGDPLPAGWIRFPNPGPGPGCRELDVRVVREALRLR